MNKKFYGIWQNKPSGLRAGSLEVYMVICGNVSDHDKSLTNASIVEFKTQDLSDCEAVIDDHK